MSITPDTTGDIATLWMKTGKLLRRRILSAVGRPTVNPQQLFAMFLICEHDRMTMKELAVHLGITSPSATSLVNRLVRMKWVVRVTDPLNRKLVRLRMAPAGKTAIQSAMKVQSKAMKDLLSLLSPEDRTDFGRVLTSLHDALLQDSVH